MEKKLTLGQNALYNSIGSIVYIVCQWLITIVVVHLGSYEAAGNLSLAISMSNMFFTFASFSVHDYQVSDFHGKYSPSIYFSTRLLTGFGGLAVYSAVIALLPGYTGYQRICILLYGVFRLAEVLVDVLQTMEQKAERMDLLFRSYVARGLLHLGGFSGVMALTGNLLLAIGVITVFSFACVLLLDLTACRRLTGLHFAVDGRASLHLLWECLPLMCNSFCQSAIVAIPRSVLEAQWGEYLLGIYASIATPAVIVQSAASWLYTPLLTTFTRYYVQRNKKGYLSLLAKFSAVIAVCIAAALIGGKLLAAWGLGLLFTEEVVAHADLLVPVLVTTIMIACSYFLSALITITRQLKVIAVANIAATLVGAAISAPIIRVWGMNGVNYVIFIAMGLDLLVLIVTLILTLKKRFSGEDDLPTKSRP